MGLAAPLLVALHSAFKFGGLAGMAYWIMMAVVVSGIVGRYLYAQIPRSRKDAELSLAELQKMNAQLGEDLRTQKLIGEGVWRPLVMPIRREEALRMPLWRGTRADAGAGCGAALPHGGSAAAGAYRPGSEFGLWAACWPAATPTWSAWSRWCGANRG